MLVTTNPHITLWVKSPHPYSHVALVASYGNHHCLNVQLLVLLGLALFFPWRINNIPLTPYPQQIKTIVVATNYQDEGGQIFMHGVDHYDPRKSPNMTRPKFIIHCNHPLHLPPPACMMKYRYDMFWGPQISHFVSHELMPFTFVSSSAKIYDIRPTMFAQFWCYCNPANFINISKCSPGEKWTFVLMVILIVI